MTKFKLVPYTVTIRKKRNKEILDIDNFEGSDIYDVLMTAMKDLKRTEIDDDVQKTVSVENFEPKDREIFGILRSGDFGIGAHFYNIKDQKLIQDARTTNDSEILPFFFHFYIPKDKKKGILILQTYRHFAVKGIFTTKLKDRNEFDKHMLEFNRLISDKALKKLLEGDLLSISFRRHSIPKDIGSQIGKSGKTDIEEVRTFKVKGKFELSERLLDAFSNKETKYYEISEEKYDEAKATVKLGGSEVVLVFGEGNTFNEFLPLDDYKDLVDGFPSFDYLKAKSSEYLKDLKKIVDG